MKHFFSGMMIALALVMALIVGVTAVAENTEPEQPALEDVQPAEAELAEAEAPEAPEEEAPEAEAPAAPEAEATEANTTTDDTALKEAMDAYRAAKQSDRQEALETELNGYVESGKLTQEQADLILKYYTEQQALRNGTCPGCGYQFSNGSGMGKGGHMNGGFGKNGGKGGRMNGNRGSFGQQMPNQQMPNQQVPNQQQAPDQQQNAAPNGTAWMPGSGNAQGI